MEYLGRIISDNDIINKKYFETETDKLKADIYEDLEAVDNKITIEKQEREYNDGLLATRMDNEVGNLNLAINKVKVDLTNESTNRINDDIAIRDRIEAVRQELLDLILNKIAEEAAIRQSEDSRVEQQLGNRITQFDTAVKEEKQAREFNDGLLASRIDRESQTLNDKITAKQDKLISGQTIKTINGQTILGSGDIVI